jgi:hypothetical protein
MYTIKVFRKTDTVFNEWIELACGYALAFRPACGLNRLEERCSCVVDTAAHARAGQPPATVHVLLGCAQLKGSAWRQQTAVQLETLGCLVLGDVGVARSPEFGTGFEAQTWLLPRPVFIGWRRTSSNPSIMLLCCLAPGLNINQ